MSYYICSCGILYGESKDTFIQQCKLKGHTLFEVNAELYALVYSMQECIIHFKETIHKRNKSINQLKKIIAEYKALKIVNIRAHK